MNETNKIFKTVHNLADQVANSKCTPTDFEPVLRDRERRRHRLPRRHSPGSVEGALHAARGDRGRRPVLGYRGRFRGPHRRDGDSGRRGRDPDPARPRPDGVSGARDRRRASRSAHRPCGPRAADPGRPFSQRRRGGQVLRAARFPSGDARREELPPQAPLADPRPAGGDVGGPGR